MSEANETKWLTTGEAARILGTSVSTVRRLADEGSLTCERRKPWSRREQDSLGRKLNGHRRVSEESVIALRDGVAEAPETSAEKS